MKLPLDEWKNLQKNFLTIAQQRTSEMKEALLSGNFSLIQHYAHQLKGSASSYGFPELGEISGEIEKKCASNSFDQVNELVLKLHALIEKLISELK